MYPSHGKYKHKSSFFMFLVLLIVLGLFLYSAKNFFSNDAVAESNKVTKEEITTVVRDVIKNNPELIMESMRSYQEKAMQESIQKTQQAVNDKKSDLEAVANVPYVGDAKYDITIVEFFDYRCSYCKTANKALREVPATDQKIRLVYRELPILGPDSELAAKFALAVYKLNPAKYSNFHNKLMDAAQLTKDSIEKIIVGQDLNLAKIKEISESSEVKDMLDVNRELARSVQIHGTPAFIINGQYAQVALDPESFKSKIAEIRKK